MAFYAYARMAIINICRGLCISINCTSCGCLCVTFVVTLYDSRLHNSLEWNVYSTSGSSLSSSRRVVSVCTCPLARALTVYDKLTVLKLVELITNKFKKSTSRLLGPLHGTVFLQNCAPYQTVLF